MSRWRGAFDAMVAKNLCDYGQLHVVGMACGFVWLLWVVKKFELAVCCLVEEEDAHEFKVERWSKKALESGCDVCLCNSHIVVWIMFGTFGTFGKMCYLAHMSSIPLIN